MSVKQTSIPITPVRTLQESFAVETAIRAVERFLSACFPSEFVVRQRSGAAIVGQWISLMLGREQEHAHDIVEFTQDLLMQIQVGKERTLVSDALSFFLGGLMPTYTRAKVLAGMLADRRPAVEVEGYFHHIGYGSVKKFIDENGAAIKTRALDRYQRSVEIVSAEVRHLEAQWNKEHTILVAQASPAYSPAPVGAPAANDPTIPRPRPNLRLVPPLEPAPPAPSGASRLLPRLAALLVAAPQILVGVVLMGIPANIGRGDPEAEFIKRQQEERAKQQLVPIPQRETQIDAAVNQSTNECQSQIEGNQKNGAQCEDDGYVLMERNLQYQRLVDPPKGRGLDGLFEKLEPGNAPNPMPETVQQPKPGKLIFIPPDVRPPQPSYDFIGKPPQSRYPKFVVWEAKHISKTFEPSDTEAIRKAGKNALGNTCDGAQMGKPWTERRIPQALNRDKGLDKKQRARKSQNITDTSYARWIFLCLPGPIGDSGITKLYVLIDVVAAGLDLESIPAKPRKPPASKNDTGY